MKKFILQLGCRCGMRKRQLLEIGTLRELRADGLGASHLLGAGFSVAELKSAGFAAWELKKVGLGVEDILDAGFSPYEIMQLLPVAELKSASFSEADPRRMGFTRCYTIIEPTNNRLYNELAL